MSLGIIWGALALVALLAASLLLNNFSHKASGDEFDRDVVAVTEVTTGDKLQPMSAKIVASDNSSMIVDGNTTTSADYTDVWQKLELLAPESVPENERMNVIETFLFGLNYKAPEKGGVIVSIANGNPISPETLTCYLNGYIADKPYLKPNCPAY